MGLVIHTFQAFFRCLFPFLFHREDSPSLMLLNANVGPYWCLFRESFILTAYGIIGKTAN